MEVQKSREPKDWGAIQSFIDSDREGRRWCRDTFNQTERQLEKLFSDGAVLSEEVFDRFLTGYQAYSQLLPHLGLLKMGGSNQEVRTRLYRLPFYSALIESCLSNLLRAIVLLINSISEKDYSEQSDLNPLCSIVVKYGMPKLGNIADTKIRNAISHGRVNTEGLINEIVFHAKVGNKKCIEKLTNYEFDQKIMNTLDVVSGGLLAIGLVIGRHVNSISLNDIRDNYVRLMVGGFAFSDSECRCVNASLIKDKRQLNYVFSIEQSDDETAFRKAGEVLLAAHSTFTEFDWYYVSFLNERLSGNCFRAKKEEIELIKNAKLEPEKLVSLILKRKDIIWYGFGKEDVNEQEVKYFRFPEYEDKKYSVHDLEDVSLDDRKRLKGNVFVNGIDDREEIIDIVAQAIDWVKELNNPPSLVLPTKHGQVEADCVYLTVYRDDNLRDSRELTQNNFNFVCSVEYCTNPDFALREDNNLLKYLYQNKDQNGFTKILWREKKHVLGYDYNQTKRNDPCPCGSGKKFKKCHGSNL